MMAIVRLLYERIKGQIMFDSVIRYESAAGCREKQVHECSMRFCSAVVMPRDTESTVQYSPSDDIGHSEDQCAVLVPMDNGNESNPSMCS
jgi:hypothetical protein